MDVFPLEVLDHLRLDGLGIRELNDSDGNAGQFCKSGGSQATCSGNNFVLAFLQFAHQKRCENALSFEAGG